MKYMIGIFYKNLEKSREKQRKPQY